MTFEQYLHRMMTPSLASLRKYLPGVYRNRGTEPLHRTRVALRRLRNVLKVFENFFPNKKVRRWNTALRALGQATGAARDLDVQMIFLRDYLRPLRNPQERRAVGQLIVALKEQRAKLQPALVRSVKQFERSGILNEMLAVTRTFLVGKNSRPFDALADVGREKIKKRLKTLLSFEKHVYHPRRVEELHRMRIAAKHLRYTLEGFFRYYGNGMTPHIQAVLLVHRTLGTLHDDDVWLMRLADFRRFAPDDKDFQRMLARMEIFCRRHRGRVYRRLVKAWGLYRRRKSWEGLNQFVMSYPGKD